MSEGYPIPSQAKLVGEEAVNIVGHFLGKYPLYLDVGGLSHKVLGVLCTTFLLIARNASAPTGDLDRGVEVLAYGFEKGQEFYIYRIVAAPAATGELTATEVSAEITHAEQLT